MYLRLYVNEANFIYRQIFEGHVLNEFVRNSALPYLEDDHTEVRRAAALTCCRLFVKDPICYQSSSHAIEIISDVLDKLLTAGIADPGFFSFFGDDLQFLT